MDFLGIEREQVDNRLVTH